MIKGSLHAFTDRVLENKRVGEDDVLVLQRSLLKDGLASREEADVLIALDRAVESAHPAWSAYLVGAVVEFVVWTSRPTGVVDADAARWLVASLGCGLGPTETAVRIAFEVIREADRTDEALVAFVLHAAAERRRREEANEAQERCAA
jgi:hypothetical protein